MPVLFCTEFFPLARNCWLFTTKHTKATHAWIRSSMPRLVWGLSWQRGKKKCFPLENPRKRRKPKELFSSFLHHGQIRLSLPTVPTSAHKNSVTESNTGFQLYCVQVKLPTQWPICYGSFICLLFLFSLRQEENHSWSLRCLVFPNFWHSYYFM